MEDVDLAESEKTKRSTCKAGNTRPVILIAEDDEVNRAILKEILKEDYEVIEAADGERAVALIESEQDRLNLVLADIHMPVMDGFEVIEYIHDNGLAEKIPVIITTGDQSADVLLSGKKYHVADIVYKPFKAKDIRRTIDSLFELLKCEQSIEEIVAEKSDSFSHQYDALKKVSSIKNYLWEDTIRMTMDALLPKGTAHRRRIQNYTGIMVERLCEEYPQYGLRPEDAPMIAKCTLLHDIGSFVVPDIVFDQNDANAHRGFIQIRKRPVVGSELINLIFANSKHQTEKKHCYEICRYMRELYDGKGYPDGMIGNEIPISAQIVGLVHRYDELRFQNSRVHSHKTTVNMITEAEYKSYNPDLLDIFDELQDEFDEIALRNSK